MGAVGLVAPVDLDRMGGDAGGGGAFAGQSKGVGLQGQHRAIRADDAELIGAATPMPGMKISQMPVSARRRITWRARPNR
jgi:hypothetical protein